METHPSILTQPPLKRHFARCASANSMRLGPFGVTCEATCNDEVPTYLVVYIYHRIHANMVLDAYMNGRFLWFSCRQIYQATMDDMGIRKKTNIRDLFEKGRCLQKIPRFYYWFVFLG